MTNSQVRAARRALAEELEVRGASVWIAEVPPLDTVNGPDDLVATSGDGAVISMLDAAQAFAVTAEREADAAVAALEANKTSDPMPALHAVAAVADRTRRAILIGKLASMKIPGLTKGTIEQAVEDRRQSTAQRKREAPAAAEREQLLRLPLNPVRLIDELEKYYADRRVLPQGAALIEALFAMNTHTFEVFDTTPYLLYDSATGGCGKTTTLERHEHVCARAYFGVDPTPAVLYRRIDRDRPTWLLDEAKILQIQGENAQQLLALFDAGYKRGASVSRCEDHGDSIRDFQVFCPKALARIGPFKGTLLDRGIPIHIEKARGLRQRRRSVLVKQAAPLKKKLEAYGLQYRARLEELYLAEPDDGYWPEISGREAEVWGPLLIHARLAGPAIEKRAIETALHFSGQKAELAVAEDWDLTRAKEALEVLGTLSDDSFSPRNIFPQLEEKEVWGTYLAEPKSDKARVTSIGVFLRKFHIAPQGRTTAGTSYSRLMAMAALERHMPEQPPKRTNPGADATAGGFESPDTAPDTSKAKTPNPQTPETNWFTSTADTMTPQSKGEATVIEEEL